MFRGELFPFQKQGVKFLLEQPTALLADDLGLGKTIQSIAVLEQLKEEKKAYNALIVVPNALKYQWKQEILKFTDNSVKIIEGTPAERRELWKSPTFYTIVNYEILLRDNYPLIVPFDVIVLDEASRIKNWHSRTTQVIKMIKANRKIALSGTPVENKPEELHSIFGFVSPRVLGTFYDFAGRYIQYRVRHSGSHVWKEVDSYINLEELRNQVKPFVLRRERSYVLPDLPELTETIRAVEMDTEQRRMYEMISDKIREALVRAIQLDNKPSKTELEEKELKFYSSKLFAGLTLLRLCSISTKLVIQSEAESKSYFLPSNQSFLERSNKFDELKEILTELQTTGKKVVIFTCFKKALDEIVFMCAKEGWKVSQVHGEINTTQRQVEIERFKNEPDVNIFVSTDSSAYGVNLQQASQIIQLDVPWNPAVIEQRNGRLMRIGQKNAVNVIYLLAKDSFDERMFKLLDEKREYFKKLIGNDYEDIKFNMQQISELI